MVPIMLCLGIEGTAHTLGIGVVDERCRVLANVSVMYSPSKGGSTRARRRICSRRGSRRCSVKA